MLRGSGPQRGLSLGGVLGASVIGDLPVLEPEEVVQVMVDGSACSARRGPTMYDRVDLGVVGGESERIELLDLHGRAEGLEESSHAVLATTHAVPRRHRRGRLRGPVDVVGHKL